MSYWNISKPHLMVQNVQCLQGNSYINRSTSFYSLTVTVTELCHPDTTFRLKKFSYWMDSIQLILQYANLWILTSSYSCSACRDQQDALLHSDHKHQVSKSKYQVQSNSSNWEKQLGLAFLPTLISLPHCKAAMIALRLAFLRLKPMSWNKDMLLH